MADDVRFEMWVCRGRVCSANGSAAVGDAFQQAVSSASSLSSSVRVLRGGCYGLCELGPNVVVRRFGGEGATGSAAAGDTDADRLTLSGADNEVVYCGVAPGDAGDVVNAHVVADAPLIRLTRSVRQHELEPRTPIERRMRDLRVARQRRGQHRG
jgi:(2Fe-2S) ferredoxin